MNPYTTDTTPEAEEVQLQLIRQMSPDQRVAMSLRMTNRLILECKNAIRREHPNWNEQEVGLAVIRVNYGDELYLAVKAYLSERSHEQR
ncbi:MAG: hypothetical protein Q8M16_15760 [Pirellulaceae bacterium]|nr:hypothetical protein [Pirellulaceae bacterium]